MTFDEFCGLVILFFVLRGVWRGFERDVYFTSTPVTFADYFADDDREFMMVTRQNFKQMYSRF